MKKLLFLFVFINSALFAQLTIDPVNPLCNSSDPITLKASQPGGYWYGMGITDSVKGTFDPSIFYWYGNAKVHYYIGNQSASLDISIKVSPYLDLKSEIQVCKGATYELHPFYILYDDATFEWSGAGNGNDSVLSINQGGNYNIKVTSTDGCSRSKSTLVKFTDTIKATYAYSASFCPGQSTLLNNGYPNSDWAEGTHGATLKVSAPGTYHYYTQGQGCVEQGSYVVSVINYPSFHLSDTAICTSSFTPTVYNLMGGYNCTYKWETPEGTFNNLYITGHTSGKYKLSVSAPFGCTFTDSAIYTLKGIATFNLHDTILCSNTPFILNGPAGYTSYKWMKGNNVIGNNPSVALTESGIYSLSIGKNGCSATDSVNVHYNELALHLPDQIICKGDSATLNIGFDAKVYSILWSNSASTSTIKVPAGTYSVNVTSPQGCKGNTSVKVTENAIGKDALILSDSTSCSPIYLKGGYGPGTYTWTSPDGMHTTQNIWAFTSGTYKLKVQLNSGCTINNEANITIHKVTPPTVVDIGDSVICKGKTKEVKLTEKYASYTWETYLYGSNTKNTSHNNSITLSEPAYVSIYVKDDNGCPSSGGFYFKGMDCDSAYTVSGFVFEDANKNGVKDKGEKGKSGIYLWIQNPDYSYAITDKNGHYEFTAYKTHGIKIVMNSNEIFPLLISSDHIDINLNYLPTELNDQNFGYFEGNIDVSTSLTAWNARPGFKTTCRIQIKNKGKNAVDSLHYSLTFDENLLTFENLNGRPYTKTGNTISFDILPLNVGENWWEDAIFTVKAGEENLGKILDYKGIVTLVNDEIPKDNISLMNFMIRGSYDPNFKASSFGDGDIADSTSEMEYTIHFQNTGSDTAITIVVKDSLDKSVFDIHSVEDLMGSHNYNMNVDSNGLITVTFANIMLADSTTNEKASHGFIKFKVALNDGLKPGTNIDNTAAIYFDFNSPIITNTAHNRIEILNSVQNINNPSLILKVYPNPTQGDAFLEINGSNGQDNFMVSVVDLLGKEVIAPFSVSNVGENNRINISSNALSNGMYFVKVSGGNYNESIPLVVHD